jgi:hypothetical protein
MSLIGWSKKFEEYERVDVTARVKKTEQMYWCALVGAICIMVAGIFMMGTSPSPFGVFLAIGGAIDIALVKLWAHIRLATYQIILELRLRDKEAQQG